MKKHDLVARLARKSRTSTAAAADQLDRMIHDIIAELKKGKPVPLPGLGTFRPGKLPGFEFDAPAPKEGTRRAKKR